MCDLCVALLALRQGQACVASRMAEGMRFDHPCYKLSHRYACSSTLSGRT
ncbi:hypothetical protein ALP66_03226 [Pseudomonas amygdali pv. photiniae]|uniref:Uncharacterized protein n=1 Tax=Pseudomonas amygdali pv. photiniae TaxID=251724 RepID=A0A658KF68_PSEA0|nr:hypothetical protein ALP66_03226 [Pseudomonas amygdali pv. photiniae]